MINPQIIEAIEAEYERSTSELGNFYNAHEGIAIIREEYDELWDEIKRGQNKKRMREEAIHVATMAIRFINDVC